MYCGEEQLNKHPDAEAEGSIGCLAEGIWVEGSAYVAVEVPKPMSPSRFPWSHAFHRPHDISHNLENEAVDNEERETSQAGYFPNSDSLLFRWLGAVGSTAPSLGGGVPVSLGGVSVMFTSPLGHVSVVSFGDA